MIRLGVNIDHVATLRQQRMTTYPDPVRAAVLAEEAGADLITLHLREDRRHIQDKDVFNVRDAIATRMNLECAITTEMLNIAKQVRPYDVCLVPEKRHELTTEGGLNVVDHFDMVKAAVHGLKEQGIRVSLFIDPDEAQIEAAYRTQADAIEIHTGEYAEQFEESSIKGVEDALNRVKKAISLGLTVGLQVNAGHGLHYTNVSLIAGLAGISELNIGHAIVAYAVFEGWHKAVSDMKALLIQHAPRVTL